MRAPGLWRRPRPEPSARRSGPAAEGATAVLGAPAATRTDRRAGAPRATASRATASRITAAALAVVLRHPGGVVVQDDTGAVWAIARFSEEQAEDPRLVVLLDHRAARGHLAEAGGDVPAAARRATADLLARGDLV